MMSSDHLLTQPWLIENSLCQYAKMMYLRHPNFIQLSINGHTLTNLINPYNKLMLTWTKKTSQMNLPGV